MSRVPQTTERKRKQPKAAAPAPISPLGPGFRPPVSATFPPLLTSEEIAPHFRKSVETIRRLAARGKIKGAVKIGRDWRFHPAILNQHNGAAKA